MRGWQIWPVSLNPPPRSARRAAVTVPHRQFTTPGGAPRPTQGLYPGEPATCRRDLRDFAAILLHLGLLLAVFKSWRIEGRGLHLLVTIVLVVLPLHYLLPYRYKQPCFVLASLLGLFWVFGSEVAAWVLGGSALVIGACLAPWAWPVRATAVASLALLLGSARAFASALPVPESAWPVLGSMFIFRTILLLYELKHAPRPERPLDVIGYFFLLPNYAFLHFPVVDYRTLLRGYFAADIHATQRRGLAMMTRGTIHLLLYRIIQHRLLIAPTAVDDLPSLAGFLVCNYLLYLHVSGQFHLACGMLHLFGYQLPETHHHYLLATGFTDYWRRINIYWKDFMVRVVFNPVVFRLKRIPRPLALAVGTIAVFLTTWALHAYQKFWLQGRFGFSIPDALFWGVLGVLVLVNVQQDARAQRRPRVATPKDHALRALKIVGTFTTIAVLWSLWSSPSLEAWLALFRQALGGTS